MNSIINPWTIYCAEALGNASVISHVIAVLLAIALIGTTILRFIDVVESDGDKERQDKELKRIWHANIVLVAIFLIGATLIPSKDTIYAMTIARNITPDNIEIVGEGAKGVVDYIFEKIEGLEKE